MIILHIYESPQALYLTLFLNYFHKLYIPSIYLGSIFYPVHSLSISFPLSQFHPSKLSCRLSSLGCHFLYILFLVFSITCDSIRRMTTHGNKRIPGQMMSSLLASFQMNRPLKTVNLAILWLGPWHTLTLQDVKQWLKLQPTHLPILPLGLWLKLRPNSLALLPSGPLLTMVCSLCFYLK